jgi:hypothetical protein
VLTDQPPIVMTRMRLRFSCMRAVLGRINTPRFSD